MAARCSSQGSDGRSEARTQGALVSGEIRARLRTQSSGRSALPCGSADVSPSPPVLSGGLHTVFIRDARGNLDDHLVLAPGVGRAGSGARNQRDDRSSAPPARARRRRHGAGVPGRGRSGPRPPPARRHGRGMRTNSRRNCVETAHVRPRRLRRGRDLRHGARRPRLARARRRRILHLPSRSGGIRRPERDS